MAGKRPAREELEERLGETEAHLVRLRVSDRVEIVLARKYGVSRRTVRRWVQTVHEKWAAESQDDSASKRAMRRSDYRSVLNDALALAMNRTKIEADEHGSMRKAPDPDIKTALHVVAQLRKLDAVDAPEAPVRVDLGGRVEHEHAASASGMAALEAFLVGRARPTPDA
jgi:hypothetical protein